MLRSSRYLLPIVVLLTAATWLGAAPSLTPMVNLTVDSESVQYDDEARRIHAEGETEIRVEVEGRPQQRLLIRTNQADADLQSQQIEATGGVALIVPGALLEGDSLRLDAPHQRFSLEQALAIMDLSAEDAPLVLGQMLGDEIGGEGEVFYLRHGMLSPFSCADPPLALRARSLEYNRRTHDLKVKGGAVDFYGFRLPLFVDFEVRVGGKRETTHTLLPLPRYSGRNGIFLPYYYDLTADRGPLHSEVEINLTAKRGITFLSQTRQPWGSWQAEMFVSRAEDVRGKLTDVLVYDRLPELRLTTYQDSPAQDQGWEVALSLGSFSEQDESADGAPEVHRRRAQLGANYEWGRADRERGQGGWAQLGATGAVYSQGEHYTEVVAALGAGQQFSHSIAGQITLLHHFTGGHTPFQFDEVDIRTELRPGLDLRLARSWQLLAQGRWEVDNSSLRDYRLELRKRLPYLTWALCYKFIGQTVGVKVYLNGLTGDTAPPALTTPNDQRYLQAQQQLRPTPEE